MKRALIYIACTLLAFQVSPAKAVTECQNRPVRVFVDTDAVIWIIFEGGQQANLTADTRSGDRILSLVLTAISTGRVVTYRLATDGVSCASTVARGDLIGLWFGP